MIEKRIICPQRLRRVPKQFSWVDQRLVRNKHLCGLSSTSLGLYLFLVTVADAEGLSYYSEKAIKHHIGLCASELDKARLELCKSGLIAYSRPFYQILSLTNVTSSTPREEHPDGMQHRADSDTVPIAQVLRQLYGGANG